VQPEIIDSDIDGRDAIEEREENTDAILFQHLVHRGDPLGEWPIQDFNELPLHENRPDLAQ